MDNKNKSQQYNYPFRYCNSQTLCKEHGITYATLERWNREEKELKRDIPGKIIIPGVRSYIWNPTIFHDQFLMPKLESETRNEYEQREHLTIINNLKQKRAINE